MWTTLFCCAVDILCQLKWRCICDECLDDANVVGLWVPEDDVSFLIILML